MNAPHRTLCPECLSTLETAGERCPHCGSVLATPRRAGRWLAGLAVLAAVGAGVAWFSWRRAGSGPGQVPAHGTAATASQPTAPATPAAPAPQRVARTTPFWKLTAEDAPDALFALGLAGDRGPPAWFVPLGAFPLRGAITDAGGGALDCSVITWSVDGGFVLLAIAAPQPAGVVPVPARSAATLGAREAVFAAGGEDAARELAITGRVGGRLQLSAEVPAGLAILDAAERAVGYTLGGTDALAVDPAIGWLSGRGTQDLESAQREIRARSPRHVVEDAKTLRTQGTPDAIRQAIALLEPALHLTRERDEYAWLEAELRATHHALLVALADRSAGEALAQARASLARFPQDPGLLADAIVLALRAEDGLTAIAAYRNLLAIAPDRVTELVATMIDGLLAIGRRRLRENRPADAIGPLLGGVELFPARADLRAAYARALQQVGELEAAWGEASEAARLDPTHRELAEHLAARVQRARDPQRVEIPFDPETNVIRTEVSVGGVPLKLVVDTGASLTTVPSAVADQLGLRSPNNRRLQIQTASGLVEGEVVQLPVLAIGGLRLARVNAVVLDLPGTLAGSGLLGMNVLSRWNLQIDGQNGRLILQSGSGGGR